MPRRRSLLIQWRVWERAGRAGRPLPQRAAACPARCRVPSSSGPRVHPKLVSFDLWRLVPVWAGRQRGWTAAAFVGIQPPVGTVALYAAPDLRFTLADCYLYVAHTKNLRALLGTKRFVICWISVKSPLPLVSSSAVFLLCGEA